MASRDQLNNNNNKNINNNQVPSSTIFINKHIALRISNHIQIFMNQYLFPL